MRTLMLAAMTSFALASTFPRHGIFTEHRMRKRGDVHRYSAGKIHGLVELFDRFLVARLLFVDLSQKQMRKDEIGIQLEILPQLLDRKLVLAYVEVVPPQVKIGDEIQRIELQSLETLLQGLLSVAHRQEIM